MKSWHYVVTVRLLKEHAEMGRRQFRCRISFTETIEHLKEEGIEVIPKHDEFGKEYFLLKW
jgi:hypothetical protein